MSIVMVTMRILVWLLVFLVVHAVELEFKIVPLESKVVSMLQGRLVRGGFFPIGYNYGEKWQHLFPKFDNSTRYFEASNTPRGASDAASSTVTLKRSRNYKGQKQRGESHQQYGTLAPHLDQSRITRLFMYEHSPIFTNKTCPAACGFYHAAETIYSGMLKETYPNLELQTIVRSLQNGASMMLEPGTINSDSPTTTSEQQEENNPKTDQHGENQLNYELEENKLNKNYRDCGIESHMIKPYRVEQADGTYKETSRGKLIFIRANDFPERSGIANNTYDGTPYSDSVLARSYLVFTEIPHPASWESFLRDEYHWTKLPTK